MYGQYYCTGSAGSQGANTLTIYVHALTYIVQQRLTKRRKPVKIHGVRAEGTRLRPIMLFFPFFMLFFLESICYKSQLCSSFMLFFSWYAPIYAPFWWRDYAPNAFLCYHIMLVFGGNTSPMLNKVIKWEFSAIVVHCIYYLTIFWA